jgi:hypothetical protein
MPGASIATMYSVSTARRSRMMAETMFSGFFTLVLHEAIIRSRRQTSYSIRLAGTRSDRGGVTQFDCLPIARMPG